MIGKKWEGWIVKQAAYDRTGLTAVSAEQIEALNTRRVAVTCFGTLVFELINLLNPEFWERPSLWAGAIYLSTAAILFLLVIYVWKRRRSLPHPERFHLLFWIVFAVGFFPFLVRDAEIYSLPMNCVLLAGIMICAPLLKTRDLAVMFGISALVNIAAALYAGAPLYYYLQLVGIDAAALFMAVNLHGRYFGLLNEQKRQYDAYLEAELAHQSLQVELEKERLTNEARSAFLSRMSHDLRTPLNCIIGASRLAMDKIPDDGPAANYLHEIDRSSEYLLSLINDVLDMSKIDSGRMELHLEPYDIADFVDTVNSVIGQQCAEKRIAFHITVPDTPVRWVMLDKLRFNQIFLNLLSNSVKFTPEGGCIELVIEHIARHGNRIQKRFIVRDSGIGMSPAFLEKAFEPFSQEQENDNSQGTGLGLAIVRNIVTLMNGTIRIESEQGHGTSVIVELEVEVAEKPVETDKAAVPAWTGLAGRRILLCEDHPINTEIATVLLEQQGLLVEHAENGRIGMERFAQSPEGYYDAVLMDIRMPVMDGLETARAIREMKRIDAQAVPIIAMTANTFDEDREASVSAGMDAHLAKPIEPQVLYNTLALQFDRHYREKTMQSGEGADSYEEDTDHGIENNPQ